MELIACAACGTRVVPKPDGSCPACKKAARTGEAIESSAGDGANAPAPRRAESPQAPADSVHELGRMLWSYGPSLQATWLPYVLGWFLVLVPLTLVVFALVGDVESRGAMLVVVGIVGGPFAIGGAVLVRFSSKFWKVRLLGREQGLEYVDERGRETLLPFRLIYRVAHRMPRSGDELYFYLNGSSSYVRVWCVSGAAIRQALETVKKECGLALPSWSGTRLTYWDRKT